MNFHSKRGLGMGLVMAVTFSHAQITTADNGLTTSGTAPNKNVSLGGTLANSPTSIDFGSSNSSSSFLLKKGTSNYFFVNNGGNIGIGNNSPTQKLDVTGMIQSSTGFKYGSTIGANLEVYGTYGRLISNTTTDGLMFLTSKIPSSIKFLINNGGRGLMLDGSSSNLLFMDGSGNSLGGIGSANGTGHLVFLYSTGINSQTEGMRLTNTGNVGIGITTPTAKLHTSGTVRLEGLTNDNAQTRVLVSDANGNITYRDASTFGSGGSVSGSTNYIAKYSSTTSIGNSLLFDNGTNVGIGTATPDQLLTLNAGSGVNSLVSFKQNTTTKAYVGMGMDGVFRNQTLSGIELQLRADGASNFVSLYTNTTEKMRVTASGNVGIGTETPRSKFDLWGGDINVTGNDGNGTAFITSHEGVAYFSNNTYTNGIAITDGGSIGIGTSAPGPYKLAVAGTIGARKIKVTLADPWADFVFEKDYPLPTLPEVDQFIQKNKHLPGVPSAEEVKKNGLDIAETQAILLQKIEELTLYIIEQNKKIEEQGKRIEMLERE